MGPKGSPSYHPNQMTHLVDSVVGGSGRLSAFLPDYTHTDVSLLWGLNHIMEGEQM